MNNDVLMDDNEEKLVEAICDAIGLKNIVECVIDATLQNVEMDGMLQISPSEWIPTYDSPLAKPLVEDSIRYAIDDNLYELEDVFTSHLWTHRDIDSMLNKVGAEIDRVGKTKEGDQYYARIYITRDEVKKSGEWVTKYLGYGPTRTMAIQDACKKVH